MKLFTKYDPLTIERTAAKFLLATMLFVVLGVLMLGCAPVRARRMASDQSCRWRPTSYRLGLDSVMVMTDSAYVCVPIVRSADTGEATKARP